GRTEGCGTPWTWASSCESRTALAAPCAGIVRQPLRERARDQADEAHDERDRVHDRQVLALPDEPEQEQRQGVLCSGREVRDDDLVPGKREGEQASGDER